MLRIEEFVEPVEEEIDYVFHFDGGEGDIDVGNNSRNGPCLSPPAVYFDNDNKSPYTNRNHILR